MDERGFKGLIGSVYSQRRVLTGIEFNIKVLFFITLVGSYTKHTENKRVRRHLCHLYIDVTWKIVTSFLYK